MTFQQINNLIYTMAETFKSEFEFEFISLSIYPLQGH